MNINDFRKIIFMNSQYCNWYYVGNSTILAGIMRNIGYMYTTKLSSQKLKEINSAYRKFTTIMNCAVALEIILYIYLIIFPFFTKIMQLPYFIAIISLCFIPMLALYLTYIVVNSVFEKFLAKNVGIFKKTAFKPSLKYIDENAFVEYQTTPRKSVYVMLLLAIIFFGYVFTPFLIADLNSNEKHKTAEILSNSYLTFVPISSETYVQRAYAKFKQKKYEASIKDYKLANKYTMSDDFNTDILGVKTYYLSYDKMIAEFDNAIELEPDEPAKYLLRAEKAAYLVKNKKYNEAYPELNRLITAYKNNVKVAFSPAAVYNSRSITRMALGDLNGAKADKVIAEKMCPDCQFTDSYLIRKP